MEEVNILGRARRGDEKLLVVGESKAQLSWRDIDRFLSRRLAFLDTAGPQPFPVIVAHMISQRGAAEYGRQQGVAVYLSYQLGERRSLRVRTACPPSATPEKVRNEYPTWLPRSALRIRD